MADGASIKVEGLAELQRRMHELPQKLARSGLRSATNAGIQVIKKEAQAMAPEDTGRLKKAIFVKRSKSESSMTKEVFMVAVRVGRKAQQKAQDAYYWFMQEFGTQKQAAQPFMRPAFESKKQEAFEKFREKLRERLRALVPGA